MKILLIFTLLLTLISCEKDPYPEGSFTSEEGRLRQTPRADDEPVPPNNSADIQEKHELHEGKLFKHKFKIEVPRPGKPIVWVENMPKGAEFDPETLEISWKPNYKAGNDKNDPTIRTVNYFIKVNYKSSEDEPNEHKNEIVNLEVIDVPQKFDIDAYSSRSIKEGNTLEYPFSIDNDDYPQGPFKVATEGMPANTQVVKVPNSDTDYKLVFTPDYQHVKINANPNPCNGNKDCLLYSGKIIVTNPANHETSKDIDIKVKDVRRDLNIVTPNNTQQGLDISFGISVVDPNGEIAPVVSLDSRAPDKGEFKTQLTKDEVNNLSVLSVSWKDIPPTFNGKTVTFRFKACVLGSWNTANTCQSAFSSFEIVVKNRNAPFFERSAWKQGEIKYLKHQEVRTYYIKALDGDNTARTVDNVKVVPTSMQKHVQFNDGRLNVRFNKPGIHQFSLVATSDYNLASSESFVVEVFSPNRSDTLYFTDSTRDAEAKFYQHEMAKVELLNPVLQPLNKRNLSGRQNLILGTSILKDPSLKGDIQKAMMLIPNIVISTPILENMPEKFLDDLANKYKISIRGRYNELGNPPDLKDMYFVVRSDFTNAKSKIRLKTTATDESFNPVILSIPVDREDCADVMDFTNRGEVQRADQYKIGVICNRDNGGRFAILGTEFADLAALQADKTIPGVWLREMLNVNLNNKSEVK